MSSLIEADICVIGGGSGGLSVAAGAAQLGAPTVLIEADRMGGDCLNVGCVPSKSLIAAAQARACHASGWPVRHRPGGARKSTWPLVKRHIEGVIAGIAPHDSVERFEGLGVRVIRARARFTGPQDMVEAGGQRIKARRFVIATGSRPAVPPVEGLDAIPFFTNETIFANDVLPEHLDRHGRRDRSAAELAQAYRRLGARVTILDIGPILPKDDPELVAVVRAEPRGRRDRDPGSHRGACASSLGPRWWSRADGEERRIAGLASPGGNRAQTQYREAGAGRSRDRPRQAGASPSIGGAEDLEPQGLRHR
jgi:pyruvate/2-oxoglutarate dehydrogenase complex dihydrolipoamide dehydrogenase (E3) component